MPGLIDLVRPKVHAFDASGRTLERRTYRIDCELRYEVAAPTEFIFLVHAQDTSEQLVTQECLSFRPALEHRVFEDHARGHRFTRLSVERGEFTLSYRALVRRTPPPALKRGRETPIAELPDALLPLLLPTRYCESDKLASAAQKLFGGHAPGHARVQAIADWIHDSIEYAPGSTDTTTTAGDVFVRRAGVCRDFAHLGIAMCRALNIPARLVVGHAPFEAPPPDFHAIFEAWLGGRWVAFDPTRMSPVEDLVRIATGRDAKDVAFATFYGPAKLLSMEPRIERVDARAAAAHRDGAPLTAIPSATASGA
ncbi:MAG TPA: transglutaminase family protein [Methylibium sp.]|uniref:transglutaminase-like domain-containing protein n=1 Tax=Methylibium sp. TaxID=2067992 RepID=UPI002DB68221|nr:transglutaminase family protein [Methylibium sp.]HEU4459282.1 transglutaminase family protein [Methylibium sp.]